MDKIYCVEDDSAIRELLCYTLKSAGFEAHGFECAADFFAAVSESTPSLVLLDLMLPDLDGMKILERLRANSKTAKIPSIIVSAKSDRMDRINGLDLGADDYVTKPFDVLELISRVRAVLRRCEVAKDDKLTCGAIVMDYIKREVTVSGESVALTFKEFELLHILMKEGGTPVTRERLLSDIWGTDFEGESRTLDVHIRTLRQKLGDAGACIETVRNIGYRVV